MSEDIHNYEEIIDIKISDLDDAKIITYPKIFIDSIVNKWKSIFRTVYKKNKNTRVINLCTETQSFENCYNVKFNTTYFIMDRVTREYKLYVSPISKQDNLCFFGSDSNDIKILATSGNLRTLFEKFFNKINTIRFCPCCARFVNHKNYYNDLNMCEICIYEEVSSIHKKETETCSICLEKTKKWYETRCGHKFHRKCLASVIPNPYLKCPLCRLTLDPYLESMEQFVDSNIENYINNEEYDDENVDRYNID